MSTKSKSAWTTAGRSTSRDVSERIADLSWRSSIGGHSLKVGESDIGKVIRDYLSPSSSASMLRCPASLAVKRICEDLPEKPFDPAPLGTRAHLVFERLFRLPCKERTKVTARRILNEVVAEIDGLDERECRYIKSALWRRIMGLWEIEKPESVLVRSTEWRLDGLLLPTPQHKEGVPFHGVIDRVDMVGDEHSIGSKPVDYKAGTGNPYPSKGSGLDEKADQIRLYAAALEVFDGRLPDRGHIYFTFHGVKREVATPRGAVSKTLERFGKAWDISREAFETGIFAAHPNGLCGWCPAQAVCPAYAAASAGPSRQPKSAAAAPSKVRILDIDLDEM